MEVTSFEQSEALLDAGLSRESADLWWIERYVGEWVGNDEEGNNKEYDVKPVTYLSFVNDSMYNTSGDKIIATPAWSLGKLIRIFDDRSFELNIYDGTWTASEGYMPYVLPYVLPRWAHQTFDDTAIGAVVKLILKLKGEGIEI